jgi:hypothetical protein
MSNWELIGYDPANGLKKYIGDNPDDPDGVLVKYEQTADSIEEILRRNKESQANGWDKKSDMWHAAHIPVGIMYEWKVKHGVDAWNPAHKDGVRRLLNSSDYRYLRVNHFII